MKSFLQALGLSVLSSASADFAPQWHIRAGEIPKKPINSGRSSTPSAQFHPTKRTFSKIARVDVKHPTRHN